MKTIFLCICFEFIYFFPKIFACYGFEIITYVLKLVGSAVVVVVVILLTLYLSKRLGCF